MRGKQFLDDQRIQDAKRLIRAALADHQSKLTGITPGDADQKVTYDDYINRIQAVRGSDLIYPYIGSGLGNGALVELADGSVKYDLINGIGTIFGHSMPKVVDACIDGALSDIVVHGNLQPNIESLALMEQLTSLAGHDHCMLTTSGAMAGENALKIAFQQKPAANRILAFSRNFMGRTCTISQITDKAVYREGLPLNLLVDYIPFCNEQSVPRLREYLARYPGQHAVMIMELVQGEGGIYPADPKYLHPLVEELKAAGVLIVADEVQSFGRTPALFAHHHFGIQESVDMVMVGKLAQVCATLWKKEINPKPGLVAQTFTSSATAIRAAKVIIDELVNGDYLGPKGKNNQLFKAFEKRFKKLRPKVEGPFGLGTMLAFTPFDGDGEKIKHFLNRLFDNGVIAFVAGAKPVRVRFLVGAGGLEVDQVDEVMDIVAATLKECS